MRIAQLSKDCSPNGGVATYVLNLSHALTSAGHDAIVIHADRNSTLPTTGGAYYVDRFDEFTDGPNCRMRAARVLEILDSYEPDVVHIQGNNNFLLEAEIRRRFAALKFLHVYDFCPSGNKFHHASGKICNHPTSALCLLRMGYKRCMLTKRPFVLWRHYDRAVAANRNNADYVRLIVASHYVKEQAIATGYAPDQIGVVPYFTELPKLPANSQDDGHTILFIGRIEREKGVDRLLQAVSLIPTSCRLILAGDGGDLLRVKRLVHQLNLTGRTEFMGWVTHERRAELYQMASIVAVPSVWPEPFGIVGLEAMSYAKPVVAFRVGGIPEWLEHEVTGYLIPPYEIQDMAERLTYLLENPPVARRLGESGRRRVEERFTSEQHVPRLLDLYHEVIHGRARPPALVS